MRALYPEEDADVIPGDWTHRALECTAGHGNGPHARVHERRASHISHLNFRCVACMRSGAEDPWFEITLSGNGNGPESDVSKPSNPKDVAAQTRAPLGLIPIAALVETSLALFEGLLKYGQANWTIAGVRSSVYVFACLRHLLRWYMCETRDPESGVHHLGSAIACLSILLDSEARGVLQDDRPPALPAGAMDALLKKAEQVMAKLTEMYGNVKPKHWTEEGLRGTDRT